MKYLVLGIFTDVFSGGGNLMTHSVEMDIKAADIKDTKEAKKIIRKICKSADFTKEELFEVFVFQSATVPSLAPTMAAWWTQEDGLFGSPG